MTEVKLCEDCKWCKKRSSPGGLYEPRLYLCRNPAIATDYCDEVRSGACGKEAKLWEPRT